MNALTAPPSLADVLGNDRLMTVSEVCGVLHVSRAWLLSPAGRAVVGSGVKLGVARRYKASTVAKVLQGETTAQEEAALA